LSALELAAQGRWVKLICGASNQDLAAVEDLVGLYAWQESIALIWQPMPPLPRLPGAPGRAATQGRAEQPGHGQPQRLVRIRTFAKPGLTPAAVRLSAVAL
jgi:hypothetical protein